MALDELVRQHERLREEAGSAGNADRAAVLRRRVEELEVRRRAWEKWPPGHHRPDGLFVFGDAQAQSMSMNSWPRYRAFARSRGLVLLTLRAVEKVVDLLAEARELGRVVRSVEGDREERRVEA